MERNKETDWSAIFLKLRRNFFSSLVLQREFLAGLLQRLESGALTSEDYQELHLTTHKLTGAGMTFGYEEISRFSTILESELSSGNMDWQALSTCIRDLIAACNHALQFGANQDEV